MVMAVTACKTIQNVFVYHEKKVSNSTYAVRLHSSHALPHMSKNANHDVTKHLSNQNITSAAEISR